MKNLSRTEKIKFLQELQAGKRTLTLDEVLIIDQGDTPGTYKYQGKILTPQQLAHLEKIYWRVICFVPYSEKNNL